MACGRAAVRSSGIRGAVRGLRTSGQLESGPRSTLSRTFDEPLGGDDRTFVGAPANISGVVRSRDLEKEEFSITPNKPRCGGNRGTQGSGGRVNDIDRDADGEFARSKMGAENSRGRELHESHHAGRREHRREGVRRFEVESTGEIGGRHGEMCGSCGIDRKFAHIDTDYTMLPLELTSLGISQFCGDVDPTVNGAVDRAAVFVNAVNTFDRLSRRIGSNAEFVDNVNPFDDQDVLLELYIAGHVGGQLLDADLARSQRAGKRAGKSPACGGDDVVERGGVLFEFAGGDPVVFGNRSVQSEADRFLLSGEPS